MNKFALSFAVLALVNGIRIRDDDLFNDDSQLAETVASIKAAEKVHGVHYNGITTEDQKNLISQKSEMHFDSADEFIKNDKRTFNKVLLQLDADISYPEARPIGEMLAQIERNSVADDAKILSGASLNDDDDANETLESLKLAENAMGAKMGVPQVRKEFYKNSGSQVENLLA